ARVVVEGRAPDGRRVDVQAPDARRVPRRLSRRAPEARERAGRGPRQQGRRRAAADARDQRPRGPPRGRRGVRLRRRRRARVPVDARVGVLGDRAGAKAVALYQGTRPTARRETIAPTSGGRYASPRPSIEKSCRKTDTSAPAPSSQPTCSLRPARVSSKGIASQGRVRSSLRVYPWPLAASRPT